MSESNTRRRTALVTGASGGIGKAIAESAARDGWDLVLTARGSAVIDAFAEEWRRRYGIAIEVIAQDLSLPGGAQALCAEVERRGLAIDCLVNNAGIGVYGEFIDTPLDDELAMLRLNIETPTVLAKRLLPQLETRAGRILNIASIAAFTPGPWLSTYHGSKAYLQLWSEAIAEELAPRGITVTAYCPGPVATGFQQRANARRSNLFRRPMPEAQTVGEAAWRACMEGRRVAVHGTMNRLQVFGMRFAPRRLLAGIVRHLSRPV